ncbi:MAG: nuclear transport factor 2 family protein [Verrucomicrobiota bacterium]
MKKILSYSLITLFVATAASFAAPDKETLMTKEKAAWQAFQDKKPDDFRKIVSADVVGLYADGINNKGISGEIDGMKSTAMKSFDLSDYQVAADGPDIAVTTYVSKIDATVDGKDTSGTFNSATVWQKQGGEWHAIFHSNVKQAPK